MAVRAPAQLADFLPAVGCGGELETASSPDDPSEAAIDGDAGPADPAKLSDVREAEAEGRSYPTAPAPDRTFPTFREDLSGTEKRRCVEVRAVTPSSPGAKMRSGEFAAAVIYLHDDGGRLSAKIPWEPLHLREQYFENSGDVSGLEVRIASLSEPMKIFTFRERGVAGGGRTAFYPSGTPLPREGPWRMIATSGPDWGCFDLEPAET